MFASSKGWVLSLYHNWCIYVSVCTDISHFNNKGFKTNYSKNNGYFKWSSESFCLFLETPRWLQGDACSCIGLWFNVILTFFPQIRFQLSLKGSNQKLLVPARLLLVPLYTTFAVQKCSPLTQIVTIRRPRVLGQGCNSCMDILICNTCFRLCARKQGLWTS